MGENLIHNRSFTAAPQPRLTFEMRHHNFKKIAIHCEGDRVDEHKYKMFILLNIIRYTIGACFLFVGMALIFQGEILPGIFSILISIISIPAIADPIESKLKVSHSTYFRFIVMLFLLMAISATVSHVKPYFPM